MTGPIFRRRLALSGLLAVLFALATVGVAHAADQGDWQGGHTSTPPQNCLDRAAGVFWEDHYNGPSHCLNSRLRDSDFQGERFGNLNNHPLNDNTEYHRNTFSTINIRAYHHTNYNTGSTCIGPGVTIGPYATGTSSGLSSFKSC